MSKPVGIMRTISRFLQYLSFAIGMMMLFTAFFGYSVASLREANDPERSDEMSTVPLVLLVAFLFFLGSYIFKKNIRNQDKADSL